MGSELRQFLLEKPDPQLQLPLPCHLLAHQPPNMARLPAELLEVRLALSQLSFKDVCRAAWSVRHRPEFGLQDTVLPPDAGHSNNNYARKITTALQLTKVQTVFLLWLQLPLRRNKRIITKHPFLLPHERVHLKLAFKSSEHGTMSRDAPCVASMHLGAAAAPMACLPRDDDAEAAELLEHSAYQEIFQRLGTRNAVLCHIYVDAVPYGGRARDCPSGLCHKNTVCAALACQLPQTKGQPKIAGAPRLQRHELLGFQLDSCPRGPGYRCATSNYGH